MITFNAILRSENVDPASVILVRHQDARAVKGRAPHVLWRTDLDALELYQRIQGKDRFPSGSFLASFVATPAGETLFIGLYEVIGKGTTSDDMVDPLSGLSAKGKFLYDIRSDQRLAEYRGKLVVDWGKGFLAWTQRAAKQDKPVVEIRKAIADPPFPGFTRFRHDIETIETIPEPWKEVLRSVKGVYVLACQETGKLYVGSAKGEESLWGRFLDYATTGHGGNVELKRRGKKPYQVTVLEIANSGEGIERLEEAWKQKLLTRQFGLNDPLPVAKVNPALGKKMTEAEMLERADRIAEEAHAGQVDKAGAPYITHPRRVSAAVDDPTAKIVALLHDVVEDGPGWTLDRLRAEGFGEDVVAAVDALTHREGEDYFDAIRRAGANPIARKVKLADLADNSDRTRLTTIGEKEEQRLVKYATATAMLRGDA